MVLVLGVSAGASGARAILAHSDQAHQDPIDQCVQVRRPGADVGEPVCRSIRAMETAARQRGELITAAAVSYRTEAQADAIRDAIDASRLAPVRLVWEPVAQLRYLRFTGRLPKSGTVILYDLGSSGLTLTLSDCETGVALRSRRSAILGGDECDGMLQRRLAHASIAADLATSRRYKEELTAQRVVTAEDAATGNRIVLTRTDLADMETAGIHHSASFIRQLVDETGSKPEAIVLLGGCARSPFIQNWLERSLNIPVITEEQPESVSARGALLLAGDRPARVVRAARAIGSAAPVAKPTSRRKLLAALAVTGVLAGTAAGLILTNQDSNDPSTGETTPTPVEVAGIPSTSFP
ncbi:Hsp70 family protein [Antrihabitans cavernicola]|uniref:Hsp70 family protein n=1 Tax=Antrihabitans cavernicola TaxID=2495913 RepID=A0A5A7SDW6_9NOCA|nr:Hsp70 family protein [Spelaeibacter cavernicola]KAA0022411.1 Hsp70 family protein [Spelaeibacter cavernicola]